MPYPRSPGLFTPFCYLVSYATDAGISPNTAFYVLAVLNAASVLGRIAPAHVADAFGRFALLVPCAFCAGLSTLLLWPAAHALAPLVLYAALYGLFSGAFNALIVPCIAQISDIREIGMRIGLLYSIISFPYVQDPPVSTSRNGSADSRVAWALQISHRKPHSRHAAQGHPRVVHGSYSSFGVERQSWVLSHAPCETQERTIYLRARIGDAGLEDACSTDDRTICTKNTHITHPHPAS